MDDKRERIVLAAKKVFSQKSFFEATLENISAESGVKKSTIYYYFDSKLDLLMELLEMTIQEAQSHFSTIDYCRKNKRAVVSDIVETYYRFLEEKIDIFLVFERAGYDFLHHPDVKKRFEEVFEKMKNIRFDIGQRIGMLKTRLGKRVSGVELLRLMTGSLNGYCFDEIKDNRTWSPDALSLFQEVFTSFLRE